MAQFPALPLWTDAYLADTVHLTAEQDGFYFRLLILLWRTPRQRVPNDDAWLASRLRASPQQMELVVRPLIAEYCDTTGNWVTQKRLSHEFSYVADKSKKQSARAKSRWNKENDICRDDAAPGIAPTPTPTPTPLLKKVEVDSDSVGLGVERSVIGEFDFVSVDGTVHITAEEFTQLGDQFPSVKNIRGLVRQACRSWLTTINPDERKRALLNWLHKRETGETGRPSTGRRVIAGRVGPADMAHVETFEEHKTRIGKLMGEYAEREKRTAEAKAAIARVAERRRLRMLEEGNINGQQNVH